MNMESISYDLALQYLDYTTKQYNYAVRGKYALFSAVIINPLEDIPINQPIIMSHLVHYMGTEGRNKNIWSHLIWHIPIYIVPSKPTARSDIFSPAQSLLST
jgi:hypothetical protein